VIKKKERNEENKILKEILLLPSHEKEKKTRKILIGETSTRNNYLLLFIGKGSFHHYIRTF